VLRLAEGRVMPRAVPVAASGGRPAGLRLVGVGGLGVGMRDGDVLTRVLGGSVGSVGDVVARVIAARDRRAREISAEFWRDGEAWSLVVEQPYLNPVAQPWRPSLRDQNFGVMNRLPVLLSALFLTSALASPAFAKVSSDAPSCGGDKKDETKKGSSFLPSCGGGEDKKETKKDTKSWAGRITG
jgi:hypothetical protein